MNRIAHPRNRSDVTTPDELAPGATAAGPDEVALARARRAAQMLIDLEVPDQDDERRVWGDDPRVRQFSPHQHVNMDERFRERRNAGTLGVA